MIGLIERMLTMRLGKKPARPTKPAYCAGDVLTLKSGGRPMTATWTGPVLFAPGNGLICQWFGNDGELQQEMFPEETLERARNALAA
ncbi:YodC family protein [Paraburkholderia sp. GAS348]|uniref:YodC family protein n=1 Tax=Paraburkholderia sp. GAS348 TaxID=3035132 RepID=UPI003D1D28A1